MSELKVSLNCTYSFKVYFQMVLRDAITFCFLVGLSCTLLHQKCLGRVLLFCTVSQLFLHCRRMCFELFCIYIYLTNL